MKASSLWFGLPVVGAALVLGVALTVGCSGQIGCVHRQIALPLWQQVVTGTQETWVIEEDLLR